MNSTPIREIFAANRAEEIGHDVWKQFVISPVLRQLGMGQTKKPLVIIGGRGCGKTMLLRYLSHQSAFSPHRREYAGDALKQIGVYWKADTQFASMLDKRGIDSDVWRAAFDHLTALVIGLEVLRSLKSICDSSLSLLSDERISMLEFSRLDVLAADRLKSYGELVEHLDDRLAEFENWANDVRSIAQPRFLPGPKFIRRLIILLRQQIPEIANSVFSVYVDEYENLNLYQQRMINTWLKHSEEPLTFNLAMKRNGFKTRETEGAEALSNIHDFRTIDLEDFAGEFPGFAAEILLSRLALANSELLSRKEDQKLLQALRDPYDQETRHKHKDDIIARAKLVLPSRTHQQFARDVFHEKNLRDKLRSRIAKALQQRGSPVELVDEFLLKDFPEASVIVPALLSRQNLAVNEIALELSYLKAGQTNRFTGSTNWIHNNFVGCYLQLFDGLVRPCPFYAGFQTFTHLAQGNLRHFLELCYQALSRSVDDRTVTPELQSEAAKQVATNFLAEVRSFGSLGNNLHAFILRLGTLFSLSQQNPSQSEPERTHFSVKEGVGSLGDTRNKFLSEAVKWSVVSETKSTKKKASNDPEDLEYVINPIYAPYFHISYRKRRKLEISAIEAGTLIDGPYDAVKNMLRGYQRRWLVDLSDAPLSLFAHLEDSHS